MRLYENMSLDEHAAHIEREKKEVDKLIRTIMKKRGDFTIPEEKRYFVTRSLLHEYFKLCRDGDEIEEMKQLLKTNAENLKTEAEEENTMKEEFTEPELEIVNFAAEDVITASAEDMDDDRPGHGYGDKNHDHKHWKDET